MLSVPVKMVRGHRLRLKGRFVGVFSRWLRCDVTPSGGVYTLGIRSLRLPVVGERTVQISSWKSERTERENVCKD